MKMIKPDTSTSSDDCGMIRLENLHMRLAAEFCDLAKICRDVENALGAMIEHPDSPPTQPIVSLQGLDRLRQSLEDMSRLSELLSHAQGLTGNTIKRNDIRNSIVLGGLADRLTTEPTTGPSPKHDAKATGVILWE